MFPFRRARKRNMKNNHNLFHDIKLVYSASQQQRVKVVLAKQIIQKTVFNIILWLFKRKLCILKIISTCQSFAKNEDQVSAIKY